MQITTPSQYADAIDHANRLRAKGFDAETCADLAELDASIQAYEQRPDQPDRAKGKPPYEPPHRQ